MNRTRWYAKPIYLLVALVLVLSFTLVPAAPVRADPGWLGGWAKRVKLTIDNGDIDAALSNFPILVYLSTSSGREPDNVSVVFDELTDNANRKKIAVTESDGTTECYVEIEKWDDASPQAWLWVKVPAIAHDADTDLYLYYDSSHGNNTAYVGNPSDAVVHNVWDSNFKLVTHMRDDPDNQHIRDSTVNANDGTKGAAGAPAVTTSGKIDDAQDFDGDHIDCGSPSSLDNLADSDFSVETWIYHEVDEHQRIFDKKSSPGWFLNANKYVPDGMTKALELHINFNTTAMRYIANDVLSLNAWHHVCAVYNSSNKTAQLYVDGTEVTTYFMAQPGVGTPPDDSALDLWIGAYWHASSPSGVSHFTGIIDEARISTSARSAAWIKAIYESETDDLLDFGIEELAPPPVVMSSDSGGTGKDTFYQGETVYAYGTGFPASTTVDVYIVPDQDWSDQDPIPADVSGDGMNTIVTDGSGVLGSTAVWDPRLTPGDYDMVFDVDGDTKYDAATEAVDSGSPGFTVVPTSPPGVPTMNHWGIVAMTTLFAGLLVWTVRRRRLAL